MGAGNKDYILKPYNLEKKEMAQFLPPKSIKSFFEEKNVIQFGKKFSNKSDLTTQSQYLLRKEIMNLQNKIFYKRKDVL